MLDRHESPNGQLRIRDVLRFGWRTLIRRLPFFVGAVVAVRLVYYGLGLAESWLEAHALWPGSATIALDWIIGLTFSIASIRVSLKVVDGARPTLMDLRSTPTTIFRFALTSLSFTLAIAAFLVAAQIAAMAMLMIFFDITSAPGHLSLPFSIGISALGAAALFGAFRLGRWVIDRQLYGHVVVDRNLGPAAAFRASAALVKMARWQILGVTSLLLFIGAIVAIAAIVTIELPPTLPHVTDLPHLPWRLPHITTGWPPLANSVLRYVLGGLGALDGWLLLVTLSYAYRTLAGQSSPSLSPGWSRDELDRQRSTAVSA